MNEEMPMHAEGKGTIDRLPTTARVFTPLLYSTGTTENPYGPYPPPWAVRCSTWPWGSHLGSGDSRLASGGFLRQKPLRRPLPPVPRLLVVALHGAETGDVAVIDRRSTGSTGSTHSTSSTGSNRNTTSSHGESLYLVPRQHRSTFGLSERLPGRAVATSPFPSSPTSSFHRQVPYADVFGRILLVLSCSAMRVSGTVTVWSTLRCFTRAPQDPLPSSDARFAFPGNARYVVRDSASTTRERDGANGRRVTAGRTS